MGWLRWRRMGILSNNLPFPLMLTQWSATLNPLLQSPLSNAVLLKGILLASGDNTINHTLGAPLQGYLVVMNSASTTFYDKQNTNPSPERTLVLNASGITTVSLLVF